MEEYHRLHRFDRCHLFRSRRGDEVPKNTSVVTSIDVYIPGGGEQGGVRRRPRANLRAREITALCSAIWFLTNFSEKLLAPDGSFQKKIKKIPCSYSWGWLADQLCAHAGSRSPQSVQSELQSLKGAFTDCAECFTSRGEEKEAKFIHSFTGKAAATHGLKSLLQRR